MNAGLHFACCLNNGAALSLNVELDSLDAPTCSSLGSAWLAKIPGNKHKLQFKICSGISRKESQILHPISQPAVSLEE